MGGRERDVEVERPLLLRALGDCNTGGREGLAAEESLPERLAAWLSEEGVACLVENLGGMMHTSREGVARLRDCRHPADLLLLNFGLVDAWSTTLPGLYIPRYPDSVARRIGRTALRTVKRRLRGLADRHSGAVVPLAEFERNLQAMVELAVRANPEVLVVLWSIVPVRCAGPQRDRLDHYNRVLMSVAERNGCVFFDVSEPLEQLDPNVAFLDRVRLDAVGADQVACAMADVIARCLAVREPSGGVVQAA